MTLVTLDPGGIDRLVERLDAGDPIVVPLPSPLPYVVVGTSPRAVNGAKGRPVTQPVGVGIRSLTVIEPALQLDPETIALVRWLLFSEGAGVLVPVNRDGPPWLDPAVSDGTAFLGGAWLSELAELVDGRTHVYMSSGNATSESPAVTAPEADSMFGDALLVADGDNLRDSTVAHGSSTMIAVGPALDLRVVRPGINNAAFGEDHPAFIEQLRRSWADQTSRG